MPEVDINYVAVLVAAIANMALGAFWYSPALFAKRWIALMKVSEAEMNEMKKGAPRAYTLSFIGALVMSYVLAHIVDYAQATTIIGGVGVRFLALARFCGDDGLGHCPVRGAAGGTLPYQQRILLGESHCDGNDSCGLGLNRPYALRLKRIPGPTSIRARTWRLRALLAQVRQGERAQLSGTPLAGRGACHRR